jgi:DNA-binding NarL/FixJ family response regulator
MGKIKVILSDPQVLFREGIHFILSGEDEFEVIGETTGNEEALNLIENNPPDVAFLSMQDDKFPGPEMTRRLKRNLPSVSVVLITDKKEEGKLFDAIRSGASACLTKDMAPETLLETIRVIADGKLPIMEDVMMPGLASMVLAEFEDIATMNEKLDNLLATLSTKEEQILSNTIDGNDIEQIAYKLETDGDGIRQHLGTVINKLIANDQSRALIEAAQRSLPSIVRSINGKDGNAAEYVTRSEFSDFKENLMERVKTLLFDLDGKLVPPR